MIFVALNCGFRRIFNEHKLTLVRDLLFDSIPLSTLSIEEQQSLLLHNCFKQNNLLKQCCGCEMRSNLLQISLLLSGYHLKLYEKQLYKTSLL